MIFFLRYERKLWWIEIKVTVLFILYWLPYSNAHVLNRNYGGGAFRENGNHSRMDHKFNDYSLYNNNGIYNSCCTFYAFIIKMRIFIIWDILNWGQN